MINFCPSFLQRLTDLATDSLLVRKTKDKGFTLIELLVGITIVAVLLGLGISRYRQFNRSQIVKEAARTLKSDLVMAQSKALSGQKPEGSCDSADGYFLDGYLVELGTNNYTLKAQCLKGGNPIPEKVALPSPYDGPVGLPTGVSLSSSPDEILFKVLGHGTNLSENLVITLSGVGVGATATVTVTPGGEIR